MSAPFLNCILIPSTVASWNSTIRATVNKGLYQDAIFLYRQMKRSRVEPDHLTFPFVLKAFARIPNHFNPGIIHAHVVKSSFSSDVFVGAAMVDMYVKCRRLDVAVELFEGMPERDVAVWNVMLMGFYELGSCDKVLGLFRRMRSAEIVPDSITIVTLIQLCAWEKDLILAKMVHCLGIQLGRRDCISMANTLIAAYGKCADLLSAELVFDEIPESARSVVSWNSMISSYAYLQRYNEVTAFFQQMSNKGVRPDLSTIASLLSAYAQSERALEGKLAHSLAIKEGFDSEIPVVNTLISLYSKCGDIEAARYCFDNMLNRTCVSWSAMIDGYVKKGNVDEAMKLFISAMETSGEKPDAVTTVAVLSACGQTGSLELGRMMSRYVVGNGFDQNVVVLNALMDMYAKCGSIDDARRLFDGMHQRTVVSWTTMIMGYAMNGDFTQALDVFSRMKESGLQPNHVTFLAVLQACTHGGLLEAGLEYFEAMCKVYRIKPRLEHYACMVDLHGRRGRLREALEFIENMPIEPDAVVLGALLGACLTHRATEIAEYVAQRLFELDPHAAVSYVSMANIYAAKDRWEGVAKIRVIMKQKRARKSPGQSIVQVNGKVHAFTVEDGVHLEIYDMLDGLALQLKDAGNCKFARCDLAYEPALDV